MTRRALTPVLSMMVAVAACSDTFDPAWAIRHFRLFGARIENLTRRDDPAHPDPGATEAAPGERVHLALAFHDPATVSRAVQVAWVFCAQAQRVGNSLGCASGATVAAGPEVDFTVPTMDYGTDPMYRPRIEALVVACAGGVLGFDTVTRVPRCTGDGAEAWLMTRSIEVRLDERTPINHLPAIADVGFYRNGDVAAARVPLGADAAPTHVPRCAGDGCPSHVLEIVPAPGVRETYTAIGASGSPETHVERIQWVFAATHGTLDGAFRVDTREQPEGPIRNTWTPPATPATVRFVFTSQDVRGGFDAVQRTIVVD